MECGMWDVECGMRDADCNNAECGMCNAGMLNADCGTCIVGCGSGGWERGVVRVGVAFRNSQGSLTPMGETRKKLNTQFLTSLGWKIVS